MKSMTIKEYADLRRQILDPSDKVIEVGEHIIEKKNGVLKISKGETTHFFHDIEINYYGEVWAFHTLTPKRPELNKWWIFELANISEVSA